MRVLREIGLSDELIKSLPMAVALDIANEAVESYKPPARQSSPVVKTEGQKKMVAARRKNK